MDKRTPKHMNWEEFKAMAERKPSLEGNWIYRLEQRFLPDHIEQPYPKFDLWLTQNRFFTSFEDAVRFLQKAPDDNLYNSILTQIAIGEPDFDQGSSWLFNSDGQMIDFAPTHSYRLREVPEAFFYGRPDSRQRFKVGEIVECVGKDDVALCVVASLSPSVEWCWKYKEKGKGYILDFSDDSTLVLEGPSYRYHNHVSPLYLMKPRFSIPDNLRLEMETWIERAEKEGEE